MRDLEKLREDNRRRSAKYRANNREKCNERTRRWQASFSQERVEQKKARNRVRFGLPEPTHLCPTHCEGCGALPGKKGMHLDHDHVTGRFRGWLCVKCNTGLGMLGDNEAGLLKLLAYLRRLYV